MARNPFFFEGVFTGSTTPATFPLSVNSSGRRLQTPNGVPFLIKEVSSWGLVQIISDPHVINYVDLMCNRGFNAAKVSVINNDSKFVGDYPGQTPNWNGVAPFTTPNNFATPNPAYFDHALNVVNYMFTKNMLCFLFPAYLGFALDGWREIMVNDNDNAQCFTYGAYLGTRFKDCTNIIWAAGGDHYPDTNETQRQNAIIDGIRSVAPNQLWTAHWDNGDSIGGTLSTDDVAVVAHMGQMVNGLYSYNPANPPYMYSRIEEGYVTDYRPIGQAQHLPVYVLDEPYETEPQGTPVQMRDKYHRAMCEGACGFGFNAGPDWYRFIDWVTVTTGTTQVSYANAFWPTVPWDSMAPDSSNTYAISGRGTFDTYGYVSVIASPTDLVAYFPDGAGSSITVDMTKFTGARLARWWNPTSGGYVAIGTIPNVGTHLFSNPGANGGGGSDWLLRLSP
jgi:Protein of unknown function (DUF4038)/Putative collagen-binding domain of a collagenase